MEPLNKFGGFGDAGEGLLLFKLGSRPESKIDWGGIDSEKYRTSPSTPRPSRRVMEGLESLENPCSGRRCVARTDIFEDSSSNGTETSAVLCELGEGVVDDL